MGGAKVAADSARPTTSCPSFAKNVFHRLLNVGHQFDAFQEVVLVFLLAFFRRRRGGSDSRSAIRRNSVVLVLLVDADNQFHGNQLADVGFQPVVVADDLGVLIEQLEQLDRSVQLGHAESDGHEHDQPKSPTTNT